MAKSLDPFISKLVFYLARDGNEFKKHVINDVGSDLSEYEKDGEIKIVGFNTLRAKWYKNTFAMLSAYSPLKWFDTQFKVLKIGEWKDSFDQRVFLQVPTLWEVEDYWETPVGLVKQLNDQFARKPHDMEYLFYYYFNKTDKTGKVRLKWPWLDEKLKKPRAPPMAPKVKASVATRDVFRDIDLTDAQLAEHTRYEINYNAGVRHPITSDIWFDVQNALGQRYQDPKINRYNHAIALLEGKSFGESMPMDHGFTKEGLNKLRIYILSLGMDSFAEYKNKLLQNSQSSSEVDDKILPPFRLLNSIIYYFYFDEDHADHSGDPDHLDVRHQFLAQFSQVLMVCMYRLRPVFLKNDLVEYGNRIYRVLDDGYYEYDKKPKNNYNRVQTQVTVVPIHNLDKLPTIGQTEHAATKDLKLVSGIDFMKEYGFVLPGCQSLEEFKNFNESTLKRLVDISMRVQKRAKCINVKSRIALAMTYYRCALDLSNILISSMAQVHSWYQISTDKRLEMGNKVHIGGGQSILRGGWNLFKLAQKGWDSLKGMLSKNERVQDGLRELDKEANTQPDLDNFRAGLPGIRGLKYLLADVTYLDRVRFDVDNHQQYRCFIIERLYNDGTIMQQIAGVALAGVAEPMMEQVEDWINHKQSRDPSTKFEVLWRVKQPTAHNYGASADYLFDMIYTKEVTVTISPTLPKPSLEIRNMNDLPERVRRILEQSKKTMDVFSDMLKTPIGQAKQSRQDRDKLDTIFDMCLTENIEEKPITLDRREYEVLQNDLSSFLDRAVVYMLANVDRSDKNLRKNYVFQIIHILLSYIMPKSKVHFQTSVGPNGESGWTFPVCNYEPKEFVVVKKIPAKYPNLYTKFDNEKSPYIPHIHFSRALNKLDQLKLTATDNSENLSSYSYILMFMNTIDRILVKLGNTITMDLSHHGVFFTSIDPTSVSILFTILDTKHYSDSLLSISKFMKRDLNIVAQDMHKNKNEYQIHMPELDGWVNTLDDKEMTSKYGEFEMDVSEFRPCMKMYNKKWYYACAWNFPIRILPVLEDKTNTDIASTKIGCFNCNMYMVTPNYSFGITPSVYHNTIKLRNQLDRNLDTSETKELHAKTNYEMMFAKPMKYHLEIMPLYMDTIKQLLKRHSTKETKEALGTPPKGDLGQKFSDLGTWIGGIDNAVKEYKNKFGTALATTNPTKHSRSIVSNIIYMQFTGCYYVPQGFRRLEGGDTTGALTLAADRDEQRIQRGDLYATYPLDKMGANLSPIVYSIFYMFNGIMGIRGDLSPYIFPYYEAYNISHKKGRAEFVKTFFANKDMTRGYNIDAKMKALHLDYPTQVNETLDEAQEAQVQNQKDSSSSSSSNTSGLSDTAYKAIVGAGLWGLFNELSKCVSNQDLAKDHRDTCDEARDAIKTGTKDKFESGGFKKHGWERVMQKYPDYFAKKGRKWTDAHVVDTNLRRHDRAGNLIKRYEKEYHTSGRGMSYHQGNNDRKRRYGETAEHEIKQLRSELNEKQRDDMVESRLKYRESRKKQGQGARNVRFTDTQGNVVLELLPHNIVANVLMLAFAGLTAWGASAGTSTYTRLLDVEFRKGNAKLADLAALQKPRMACSFFFGMGLGIFVAFIASMVEMANHKRVRQALFILLVAVPIIVMGVIGVQGANKMCMDNPDKVCEKNFCKMDNVSQKGTCTWGGINCNQDTDCDVNYCDPKTSKCHFSGVDCDIKHNATTPTTPSSLASAHTKRQRYMPTSKKTRLPKLKAFYNSLMGTHPFEILGDDPTCDESTKQCSNAQGTSCQDDEDCKLPEDAVLKDQVKTSDYLFMGLGAGVLVAGICTILPDNPFHPSKFDTEYQSAKQRDFTTVSQVNPKWWIYGLVFSMIMAGSGISSTILTTTTVPVTKDDNGRDVRKSGQMQSYIAIGTAVVMFVLILVLGRWHLKRHRKLGRLMENYGSESSRDQGQRRTATGQLAGRN